MQTLNPSDTPGSNLPQSGAVCCIPRRLPDHLKFAAADLATSINPCNMPLLGLALVDESHQPIDKGHIALMTSRWWGKSGVDLSVEFLDGPTGDLRNKILSHMNAWSKYANVRFRETAGSGQVRIARVPGDGYWSYLGTDILGIAPAEPTMNLDSFTMQTPDSEFYRVVRHETGHTLGCPHEHMRRQLVQLLDPEKTIAYFQRATGWSRQMIIQQILTPLDEGSLIGTTSADAQSIMTYQIPGDCTISGQPIEGGTDIDRIDGEFMGKVYPLLNIPNPPPPQPTPRPAIAAVAVTYADGTTQTLPK